MAGKSEFMQISSISAVLSDGTLGVELFALDMQGDVWRFDFRESMWMLLPVDRDLGFAR